MSSERYDRQLIGRLLAREVERNHDSWVAFERTSGVSRATLYRVRDGNPKVEARTMRRIEKVLGYPYETLTLVAQHDWDGLLGAGVAADVVQWLRRQAAPEPARRAGTARGRTVAAADAPQPDRAQITKQSRQ